MFTVRRWYIFLVNAVSLQAVTWAIIALLRNLLTVRTGAPVQSTAFQIAIIIIGLPVFLIHWLWAQKLAAGDVEESRATLRRLYLYGSMAAFLGPFVANAFSLIKAMLTLMLGHSGQLEPFTPGQMIIRTGIALIVLIALWAYHWQILRQEAQSEPEWAQTAAIRRLYIFGLSAAGVTMTVMALVGLLRWLLFQIGRGNEIGGLANAGPSAEIARLAVGLVVWMVFWSWAQRLFAGPDEEERASVLRKLYLYLAIFIGVLGFVTQTTLMLAGGLRSLFALPSLGDVRDPLTMALGWVVVWGYHGLALHADAAQAGEAPHQAGVRRLYLYLVAAVGLAAFLIGISGEISVLIRVMGGFSFGSDLKEQVAWFTAALIAGLPVWLWPWRQAQLGAEADGVDGDAERHSLVRKIYLYFYLFVAAITVLSGAVYLVYQLLSLALGGRTTANLLTDLAQALAFSLITAGVWLYHNQILRGDGKRNQAEQVARLGTWRVAVIDTVDGTFGAEVTAQLQAELPGLAISLIRVAEAPEQISPPVAEQLAAASLIVGPWQLLAGNAEGGASPLTAAIRNCAARKLLVPVRTGNWEWAGVDRWSDEALIGQTVHAVKQLADGDPVTPARPLGAGAIIGIVIGALVVLILLAIPLSIFFGNL